jgi:WD40 repeat protein
MSPSRKWKLIGVGTLLLICGAVLFSGWHGTDQKADVDPPRVLAGHSYPIQALAFSGDGTHLTTASYYLGASADETELTDWDVTKCQCTGQRSVALGTYRSGAFAAGGRMLASPGTDHGVWLWDRDSAHQRQRLSESPSLVGALTFRQDGSLLATSNGANDIVVWDVAGRRPKARCQGHAHAVLTLSFAPDGKTLASGGADTTLRLWDVATGEEQGVLRAHPHFILALAYAPDGRALASADRGGTVVLWDVATRAERARLATSGERGTATGAVKELTAVVFSPDSQMLAVAVDRAVQLWDVAEGNCLTELTGHGGEVKCLAFSPDGTWLASGSHDRTVRLWDVARYRTKRP